MIKISVKNQGKIWTSDGKNLEEAITNLKIPNAKGMSVWKVDADGEIREKIVAPSVTYRLFNTHGITRDVALKQFKLLFE